MAQGQGIRVVYIMDCLGQCVWWGTHIAIVVALSYMKGELQDVASGSRPHLRVILFFGCFVANALAFYGVRCSDPGVIKRASEHGTFNEKSRLSTHTLIRRSCDDLELQHDAMCSICGADQSCKKTLHCRWCNKCIPSFDHHCGWLNNCVGQKNHRWFWLYIFLQTTTTGLALDLVICSDLGAHPSFNEGFLFLSLFVFLLLCFVFFFVLLSFHSFLAVSGLTSRELKHRMTGRGTFAVASQPGDKGLSQQNRQGRNRECTSCVQNLQAFCSGQPRGRGIYGHETGQDPISKQGYIVLRCLDRMCDNSWFSCF